MWAAQGVSDPRGYRTAPSAGALYPLEVRILTGPAPDLAAGIYHYRPDRHAMERLSAEDRREALSGAALNQGSVKDAPAVLVLTAVYERVARKYGERGVRYVHMEAGHAAQNVLLQAVARKLGTVPVGAFHDADVAKTILAGEEEKPLYLIPVGKPAA
jgi:SagB-type dehydrogenase family enzyme